MESSTPNPEFTTGEEEELMPPANNFLPINPLTNQHIPEFEVPNEFEAPNIGPAHLPPDQITNPEGEPCRSSHLANKTTDDTPKQTKLERAIAESKESAEQVKAVKEKKKKKHLEEGLRNDPQIMEEHAVEELREVFQKLNIADKGGGETTHLVDQVLATIADMSTIDPRNFGMEDEPKLMLRQSYHSKMVNIVVLLYVKVS